MGAPCHGTLTVPPQEAKIAKQRCGTVTPCHVARPCHFNEVRLVALKVVIWGSFCFPLLADGFGDFWGDDSRVRVSFDNS